MLPLLPFLISFTLAYILYTYLISPLLSPLSKIPRANPTSLFSPLWLLYHRRHGKTAITSIYSAHIRKKTPTLLLSPTEISLCSLQSLKEVYMTFEKPPNPYSDFQNYGRGNLVSMLENPMHSQQKRILAGVYSKSSIWGSSNVRVLSKVLSRRILELLLKKPEEGDGEGVVDFYKLNIGMGADFTTSFLFGLYPESTKTKGLNLLKNVEEREIFMANLKIKMKEMKGLKEAQNYLEEVVWGLCRLAENWNEGERRMTGAVIWRILDEGLRKLGKENGKVGEVERGKKVASEMMDQLIAGTETARISLTYLEWELSKQTKLQQRLRQELRELMVKDGEKGWIVPEPKVLDRAKFLDALLNETLRLYTPSPAILPRVTPPGGAIIEGYFIPGGITVGTSAYCLHQNASVFPDPKTFDPDRWLEKETDGTEEKERLKAMNKWFWAFGSGSRGCIGSHFVTHMMKVCVTVIYANFETSVKEFGDMEQEDFFIAGPVGEKLVLKIRSVDSV